MATAVSQRVSGWKGSSRIIKSNSRTDPFDQEHHLDAW